MKNAQAKVQRRAGLIGAAIAVSLSGCGEDPTSLSAATEQSFSNEVPSTDGVLRAGSNCTDDENRAVDRAASEKLKSLGADVPSPPDSSQSSSGGREGVWLCNATLVYIDADAMPPIDHSKNWVVEAYLQPTGDETAGMVDLGVGQRMP